MAAAGRHGGGAAVNGTVLGDEDEAFEGQVTGEDDALAEHTGPMARDDGTALVWRRKGRLAPRGMAVHPRQLFFSFFLQKLFAECATKDTRQSRLCQLNFTEWTLPSVIRAFLSGLGTH